MKHSFFKQGWLPAGGQGDVSRTGKQDGQGMEKTGLGDSMEALRTNVSIQCVARELGLRKLLENEVSSP